MSPCVCRSGNRAPGLEAPGIRQVLDHGVSLTPARSERAAIADHVSHVHAEAVADPEAFETIWHVALLRVRR